MRQERCLFQSPVNVFMTQISAYLAKAGCQLVMHIPCTHLREIRRWEELVPVSFTPLPSSSSSSSCRSADAVGPLRAHLLCCRSFGPASVWLGARWLGCHPRQSTQVSHCSTALTGPIKERQETDVRPNTSCKAPSRAKTRRGFTRIYTSWWRENPRGEASLLVFTWSSKNNEFSCICQQRCLNIFFVFWEKHGEQTKATTAHRDINSTFWSVAWIWDPLLKLLQLRGNSSAK